MSKVININFDQGANVYISVLVQNSAGQPLDLTDYTATATFRRHHGSANSHSFSCNAYANGIVTMQMDSDVSATIDGGRYVYDAFIEHAPTNTYIKIQEGILTVKPSVTR